MIRTKKGPIAGKRELGHDVVIAAMAVGDETAGALVGPLHGPAERASGVQQADIFGEDRGLHAERAADLAGQNMHVLGGDAERLGDIGAHAINALRGNVESEAVIVVDRERSARLHGVDDDAAVHKLQLRHMRRPGERRVDGVGITKMIIERNVARHVVIEERRAVARGVFRRNHGRQRLDLEGDRFGRILGGERGLGDDVDNGIADVADLVRGQRAAPGLLHRRAVAIFERHDALERTVSFQVGRGIDAEYAGHGPRGVRIDGADYAMGNAAAHHHRISLARQTDVVGITSMTAQQHWIFAARHGLSDGKFLNGQSLRRQFVRCRSVRLSVGRLVQIHARPIPQSAMSR